MKPAEVFYPVDRKVSSQIQVLTLSAVIFLSPSLRSAFSRIHFQGCSSRSSVIVAFHSGRVPGARQKRQQLEEARSWRKLGVFFGIMTTFSPDYP